ncbi:GNAT family N-acetyltransferase [Catellatospora bangladeshensis]|uniref:N-acetyltransferase n=1 Tax=Catellatospora bangladeshensis TaxID=310355 RepID=A0A8J3JRD4_9ACTN|nr:GNAT family N-acetyltransferase [Catellatospora bangladeshensis]GIF83730.1 N-acetyltransferase [Catellatospora bangladeshensis]
MTTFANDLDIRPLRSGEEDLFLDYPHPPTPGVGLESRRSWTETLADGYYRPEWSWVARRGGRTVARCAFWGMPGEDHPFSLDWFELGQEPDRLEIGAALLTAALRELRTAEGARPEYHVFLPPGWRELDGVREATEDRLAAAAAAGYVPFIERFNYTWALADGVPERSTRLVFREVDDAEATAICRAAAQGSLDGYTGRDVARHGLDEAARLMIEELAGMPSPREWWRAAYTPEGAQVGLIVPARNPARAVVGYIAVVPAQRGHGYVDDLLAETTAMLVAEGAEEIGADTDLGNRPMAAAFARAGYRNTAIRVVLQ